ncbi:MAG TPA: potassium-transporting ATPase subunit KdpC [Thermoanaerobaculia bacterium]|nr:potassium-transporting ATPase subunit KdpC [Thermoanaerobaculia bacterium]
MKEHLLPSIRLYLALTLLLGFGYPALVRAVGRIAFREAADGSLLRKKDDPGAPVGSSLIGQSFVRTGHFHGRPSAAGSGYDAAASSGTNLGPTSKKLAEAVRAAVSSAREENPTAPGPVPADAATSSGSGLDPHISPENARWQVARVSKETGLSAGDLDALIAARTEDRFLGVWGERRVTVLLLNLDLDTRLAAGGGKR